jgi:uncharacterized protein YerC
VLLSTRAYVAKQRSDEHDMMQAPLECRRTIADLRRLTRPQAAPNPADDQVIGQARATVVEMLQAGSSYPDVAAALSLSYATVRRIARIAGVRSKWERT